MAYIVMAYIVMAYIVMAYIVMAYIVMAYVPRIEPGGCANRCANCTAQLKRLGCPSRCQACGDRPLGSISASPTACPLRGYGRAGTQNV